MDLRTNTYKSVNVFIDKVLLNIHVDGARRYALKKRALKRWIYSHGYTQREIARKLHMSTKKFKRKLSQKEVFSVEQICRLVYLMGAWNAFYVIYFPTFKEYCRVYNEAFGKKWRKRRKQIEYGRNKKVHE